MKAVVLKVMKFSLALLLIYWLVRKGYLDMDQFRQLLAPDHIAILFLLTSISLFLVHVRWVLFLRTQGFPNRIVNTMPLTLIGTFFNFALPGSIGGDVVKAYYLSQHHPEQKLRAVSTILVDRLMGLYAMMLMAVVAILYSSAILVRNPTLGSLALAVVLVFLAANLAIIIALSRRIRSHTLTEALFLRLPAGKILLRVYDALQNYRHQLPRLFLGLLFSVIAQTMVVLLILYVGHVLNETAIPVASYFLLVPLGLIATSLPISPAGIGVGQVAFLALFTLHAGHNTEAGQVGISLHQMGLFAWAIVGAYFYLTRKKPGLQRDLDVDEGFGH